MNKQVIGDRIKLLRERAELSQGDLAQRARRYAPAGKVVTRNSISRYENHHTYADAWMLEALAAALETSVRYLTGQTDDPNPGEKRSYVAPELWSILQEVNKQPPELRRLLAKLVEAALNYARNSGDYFSSPTPAKITEGERRARELAEWVEQPADQLLLSSLLQADPHRAGTIDDIQQSDAEEQGRATDNVPNGEGSHNG